MTVSDDTQLVVGKTLAESVATALDSGKILVNSHRDYCGMGLAKEQQYYVYGRVYDGYPPAAYVSSITVDHLLFASRAQFIEWLSRQTDSSLSGDSLEDAFYRCNQRLTIQRLRDFCCAV